MYKLTILLAGLLLTILLLPQYSIGQENLNGKWHAYCVVEKTDRATLSFSGLCQIDISEDATELHFPVFEMLFDDESISIIQDDAIMKTNYKFDNEHNTLMFTLQEKEYSLKILSVMGKPHKSIILRDGDTIIILEEQRYRE